MDERIAISFTYKGEEWKFSFHRDEIVEASKFVVSIMDIVNR